MSKPICFLCNIVTKIIVQIYTWRFATIYVSHFYETIVTILFQGLFCK